jgi:cardiolipin synthase
MKYKLYTTSLRAWDAMILAIDGAKRSIYLEMYIFESDTFQSHDFIGKLQQKSREGLKVVIVADAFGSKDLKEKFSESLTKAGIEIHFFSHWLRHIHRKVLIIDEKIAFIGGVNIGKKYTNWNDLQLEVTGRIVKKILASFAYAYEISGGKDNFILKVRNRKISVKLRSWMVEHWPNQNIYTLKDSYIEKITGARKKIQIITPYFAPPRWLISLLDSATKKGILVEIIIPKEGDIPIMNRVNYRYAYNLNKFGVKFFLSNEMNHAKLLIIDGQEGLIGSQNIDLATFSLNAESGIFFKDKHLLKEIGKVFEDWKDNSTPFEPKHFKMRLIDWGILFAMKIFRPIL